MKLELKHLAPYLPYGLNIWSRNKKSENYSVFELSAKSINKTVVDELRKPILRPLTDLSKYGENIINEHSINMVVCENHEVEYGIFSHYEGDLDIELDGDSSLCYDSNKSFSFNVVLDIYNELLRGHFDIFGLIEKGLAIDINTLDHA